MTAEINRDAIDVSALPEPTTSRGGHSRLATEAIIQKLEQHLDGWTLAELRGPSRDAETVRVRRKAVHFLMDELGLSSAATGIVLNRDHTTILHLAGRRTGRPRGPVPSTGREE